MLSVSVTACVYQTRQHGFRCRKSVALVPNDGADVVRPVRFTAAAGRLLGLDRAAAALADFPRDMSGMIFLRMPVSFAEVGMRKSLALRIDIAELRCKSGGHLHSLDQTPRHTRRYGIQHGTGFCGGHASSQRCASSCCRVSVTA